jgi:flagellar biosynthesis/type III secretory pathway M-ring protein FliF/YscJ
MESKPRLQEFFNKGTENGKKKSQITSEFNNHLVDWETRARMLHDTVHYSKWKAFVVFSRGGVGWRKMMRRIKRKKEKKEGRREGGKEGKREREKERKREEVRSKREETTNLLWIFVLLIEADPCDMEEIPMSQETVKKR